MIYEQALECFAPAESDAHHGCNTVDHWRSVNMNDDDGGSGPELHQRVHAAVALLQEYLVPPPPVEHTV